MGIVVKKIDMAMVGKGKNVTSRDPRKPAIVAAMKVATGARKVTMVSEPAPGVFTGHCLGVENARLGCWEIQGVEF